MKEELCEKVLEIRRESDREMTDEFVFEEDSLRYASQSGRSMEEKQIFL